MFGPVDYMIGSAGNQFNSRKGSELVELIESGTLRTIDLALS
jgi:hypothetical protein